MTPDTIYLCALLFSPAVFLFIFALIVPRSFFAGFLVMLTGAAIITAPNRDHSGNSVGEVFGLVMYFAALLASALGIVIRGAYWFACYLSPSETYPRRSKSSVRCFGRCAWIGLQGFGILMFSRLMAYVLVGEPQIHLSPATDEKQQMTGVIILFWTLSAAALFLARRARRRVAPGSPLPALPGSASNR